MKLTTNVLAVLLLGVISSSAIAEGNKFYGAVDLGKSTAKNRCDGFSAASGWSCAESATAIRIAGGYQITPTWGVEASYGNYGTLKDTYSSSITTINTEVKLNGFAIHATGTLPVNNAFSLFGKLGIARTTAKGSSTSSNPAYSVLSNEVTSTKASFGVGAQYEISDKVALRAQYDDFGSVGDSNSGTMKITLLSAGLVYKF
jgi:OOP family OmpA-OmpF porin